MAHSMTARPQSRCISAFGPLIGEINTRAESLRRAIRESENPRNYAFISVRLDQATSTLPQYIVLLAEFNRATEEVKREHRYYLAPQEIRMLQRALVHIQTAESAIVPPARVVDKSNQTAPATIDKSNS